jgi:hypothetical protein
MTTIQGAVREAKHDGERAARSKTVERLGRVGYAAMGVVWFLVGALALAAAFGKTSTPDSTKDALGRIADAPLGRAALVAIGLGLLAFAVWRFVEASFDPEHAQKKTDAKQIAMRVAKGALGFIYAALGVWSLSLGTGNGGGGGGDGAAGLTARVMQLPFGVLLVGAIGVGMLAYAIGEAVYAGKRMFLKKLDLATLNAHQRRLVERTGIAGLLARAVVWSIVGTFLVVAAVRHSPQEAKGLGGALSTLQQQAYGPWLLAAVATGLAAFGVYDLVKARYRLFRATRTTSTPAYA